MGATHRIRFEAGELHPPYDATIVAVRGIIVRRDSPGGVVCLSFPSHREEVEDALADPEWRGTSRSSGLALIFGTTSTGRFIAGILHGIDAGTARPVTAYDIEE